MRNSISYFLLFFIFSAYAGTESSVVVPEAKSLADCRKGANAFKNDPVYLGLLAETCHWQLGENLEAASYQKKWGVVLSDKNIDTGLPWSEKSFIQDFKKMMAAESRYYRNRKNPVLETSLMGSVGKVLESKNHKAPPFAVIKFAFDLYRSVKHNDGLKANLRSSLASLFNENPEAFTRNLVTLMSDANKECGALFKKSPPNYLLELAEMLPDEGQKEISPDSKGAMTKSLQVIATEGPKTNTCTQKQLQAASKFMVQNLPPEIKKGVHVGP